MLKKVTQNYGKQICRSLHAISSTQQTTSLPSSSCPWSNAKPYEQIPNYSFWEWSKKVGEGRKAQDLRLQDILKDAFDKTNSEIIKIKIPFLGDQLFVNNPDDVQTLLQNDGKYPDEPVFEFFEYYRTKKRPDMFGKCPGLLGTKGKEWGDIRTAVNQDLMRPASASYYLDDIINITEDLQKLVEANMDGENVVHDLTPFLFRYAMEAVTAVFLDTRLGCLQEPQPEQAKELIKNVNLLVGEPLAELVFGLPIWKLINTKPYKIYNDASEVVHKLSSDLVDQGKQKYLDIKKSQRGQIKMLGKLIERCGLESPIPHAMAMDAIFAGMDTTGNTSSFLFYQLAANPEEQEKVYQNIMEKVPAGEALSVPSLLDMKLVKGAMNETLRLMPVVQGLGRVTQKDLVLSGYKIPDGTRVNYNFVYTMKKEKYFQNADKFMPERWVRGHDKGKKMHPFAFIPFSYGSRMCVGRRVAEMEMQVLIVQILRKYKLEFVGSKPIGLKGGLISTPDSPLTIKFIPRY